MNYRVSIGRALLFFRLFASVPGEAVDTSAVLFGSIGRQSVLAFFLGPAVECDAWARVVKQGHGEAARIRKHPVLSVLRRLLRHWHRGTQALGWHDSRLLPRKETVADCFKYRNKYGLDAALEALRDGWREKKFTMSELNAAAEACRVRRVLRPYLEMLT